jgi:very-short-patch-repair endonuclease
LASQGFRVVRFWNCEVFEDLDAVLQVIVEALRSGREFVRGRRG